MPTFEREMLKTEISEKYKNQSRYITINPTNKSTTTTFQILTCLYWPHNFFYSSYTWPVCTYVTHVFMNQEKEQKERNFYIFCL